jgi:hypothetical protein
MKNETQTRIIHHKISMHSCLILSLLVETEWVEGVLIGFAIYHLVMDIYLTLKNS